MCQHSSSANERQISRAQSQSQTSRVDQLSTIINNEAAASATRVYSSHGGREVSRLIFRICTWRSTQNVFTENVEQTETSNAGESSIATVGGWGVLIESSSKY